MSERVQGSGDRALKLLFHDNSSKSLLAKMSIQMFEYNPKKYTQKTISIFMILDFDIKPLKTVMTNTDDF